MTGKSQKHASTDERHLHHRSTFESFPDRFQLVSFEFLGQFNGTVAAASINDCSRTRSSRWKLGRICFTTISLWKVSLKIFLVSTFVNGPFYSQSSPKAAVLARSRSTSRSWSRRTQTRRFPATTQERLDRLRSSHFPPLHNQPRSIPAKST